MKENPELLEKILAYLMAAGKLELKELYKHVPEKELIQNMGIVELMVEQKKEEARAEEKAEVAKTMLIEGEPVPKIVKFTGFSEAEISESEAEISREEYLREFGRRFGQMAKEGSAFFEKILAYLMTAGELELKELYKYVPEKKAVQNIRIVELMVEQKKEEARAEEKAEVAKTMLIEGEPVPKIVKFTRLSEEEVSKLKPEVDKD